MRWNSQVSAPSRITVTGGTVGVAYRWRLDDCSGQDLSDNAIYNGSVIDLRVLLNVMLVKSSHNITHKNNQYTVLDHEL
jgi:hypothetical protein